MICFYDKDVNDGDIIRWCCFFFFVKIGFRGGVFFKLVIYEFSGINGYWI